MFSPEAIFIFIIYVIFMTTIFLVELGITCQKGCNSPVMLPNYFHSANDYLALPDIFICNCLNYFTTAKTSFTSNLVSSE